MNFYRVYKMITSCKSCMQGSQFCRRTTEKVMKNRKSSKDKKLVRNCTIGSFPELCITFHLHYISFALHLKNLPRQHEMHATS